MRSTVDAYIYYKFVKKYQFKNILEIGFYQGQTAGLLAEITESDCSITCVDPDPNTVLFDSLYKDFHYKIKLYQIPSQEFDYKQYDCIVIDGDKSFDTVSNDIKNSIRHLDDGGLILVNEYQLPDVEQALHEFMMPNGLVPFLKTDQTLFFHSPRNDRSDFLDFELPNLANNFIRFENCDLWGHVVLTATTLPIFTNQLNYFDLALKEFDI